MSGEQISPEAKSFVRTVMVTATFGGLLFGYDTGVINGALEPMKTDLGLTAFTEGVVTSSLLFGAALGHGALNPSCSALLLISS